MVNFNFNKYANINITVLGLIIVISILNYFAQIGNLNCNSKLEMLQLADACLSSSIHPSKRVALLHCSVSPSPTHSPQAFFQVQRFRLRYATHAFCSFLYLPFWVFFVLFFCFLGVFSLSIKKIENLIFLPTYKGIISSKSTFLWLRSIIQKFSNWLSKKMTIQYFCPPPSL